MIGEELARARREAGLTVSDISGRTGIRPSIVEGIENNDFAVWGGMYAQRHISAIADAVGLHAEPLIKEYETTWLAAGPIPAARAADGVLADEPTEPIPSVHAPGPAPTSGPAQALPAAMFDPIVPAPARVRRHRGNWIALFGVVLLAAAVAVGYRLAFGTGGHAARHASATSAHRRVGHAARHVAARAGAPSVHSASPGRHSRAATPRNGRRGRVLKPVHIAAFGPGGVRRGDSPQIARLALRGNPKRPWHSAWYTTPHFGNLQSGTGLILDMGHKVTVTVARIALGYGPGANLELRIGNTPRLSGLRSVARATGAGGVVRLHLRPTRGRYVLVWFTRLPPDHAGTFQASVYRIILLGYR